MKLTGSNISPSFGRLIIHVQGATNPQKNTLENLQPFLEEKGCKVSTSEYNNPKNYRDCYKTFCVDGSSQIQEVKIAEVLENRGFDVKTGFNATAQMLKEKFERIAGFIKQDLSDI